MWAIKAHAKIKIVHADLFLLVTALKMQRNK
jgi:hypothetical protein